MMGRWFLMLLSCALTYSGPTFLRLFDGFQMPTDHMWFIFYSWFSLGNIFLLMMISRSWLSFSLCIIEVIAIAVWLIACYEYLHVEGFFYSNVEVIIELFAALQALLLAIGAPWDGILGVIKRMGRATCNRYPLIDRGISRHFEAKGEDLWPTPT